MVGNWPAKGVFLGRGCAADEMPSLDRMDQANGIACWSVALGDLACRLGAATRMLLPSHLPLTEYSLPLVSLRVLPARPPDEQAVLFEFKHGAAGDLGFA